MGYGTLHMNFSDETKLQFFKIYRPYRLNELNFGARIYGQNLVLNMPFQAQKILVQRFQGGNETQRADSIFKMKFSMRRGCEVFENYM